MAELIRAMRHGYTYANVHTTLNRPDWFAARSPTGVTGTTSNATANRLSREPAQPGSSFSLDAADDREPELRGAGSVDDSVVERERYVAKRCHSDPAVTDDRTPATRPTLRMATSG